MTKERIKVAVTGCSGETYTVRFWNRVEWARVQAVSKRQAAIKASAVSEIPNAEFYYNGEKVFESGPAEPKKPSDAETFLRQVVAGVDPGHEKPAVLFFGTDQTSQAVADAANAKTTTKTARIVYKYDERGRTLLKFYDKGTGVEITEQLRSGCVCDGWIAFSGVKEAPEMIRSFYNIGGSSFSIDRFGYEVGPVEEYVEPKSEPSLRPVVCRHWQSDCKTQVRFEDSQSGLCINDKLGINGCVHKESTTKYISAFYSDRLHQSGYTIDSFVEGHPVEKPEPSVQQLQGELAAVKSQLHSALGRVENEKAKREAQRLEYEAFRNKAFKENHYWAGLSKSVSEFLLWTEQKSIADVGDQLFPAVRSAYDKLEKDLAAERKRSDVLETQVRDLQAEKTRYVAAAPVQQGQAVYACDSRGHQEIEKLTKANLELRKELGEMVDKYSELWGRVSRIKGLL